VDGITTVDNIKIDFWITPEDVATYNVADPSCKAILLASFASALEYDYKVLICQMSNGEKRHLVMVDLNSKSLLLDPNKKHNFFKYHGESSSLIADYELNDAKISKVLYEFDEREYITHEE